VYVRSASDVKLSAIVGATLYSAISRQCNTAVRLFQRPSLCLLIAQRERSMVAPTSINPSTARNIQYMYHRVHIEELDGDER